MHVLLIHQAFASPKDPGGTRHFEFANYAHKQGYQFTVVTSPLSYLTGQRIGPAGGDFYQQNEDGIRILRAYTYPSLHRSFVWRVFSFVTFMFSSIWVAMHARHVSLVMGTSPPIFQTLSAWLIAKLRHRPFLLEIRDLWPEFAIDMGILKSRLLIVLSRWLELFLYTQATHILVNSPAYRDYLLEKGILPQKITLIPNGVNPEMFDPRAKGDRVRKEFHLNGRFVVTYAGALGSANDIPTILRTADQLRKQPQIHFLLVGDGKERARLEAMARDLSLSNVTFTGARSKSEMPDFLAASDLCLATLKNIPMFRTTYPNKVFDYMAAGRPTILGIDGVIREVIEAARGGVFVQPGDDKALAKVIEQLARDPGRTRDMGNAARKYVVEHFNRFQQAQAFVDLISCLAPKI
jgi:glycosyltransferase involved in cell wall biosynthesis